MSADFCRQCGGAHGDVAQQIAAGAICGRCRRRTGTGGSHGAVPCKANGKSYALCVRGLFSIRRWRTLGGRDAEWLTAPTPYAATILRMFELPAEVARTNYTGGGPVADECWTTRDGIELLIMVQAVARTYLNVSNPAAARLLQAHPDALAEFRALWNLDARDEALQAVLDPLNSDVSAAVANRLAVVPQLRKKKLCP